MVNSTTSILVVDDEEDSCRNLSDIFTDLGYRVATANDGPSALAELTNASFDIALLDLIMPGMDGMSLYQEIKRRRPEMVAVLTTAFPNDPRVDAGRKSGIWRVVPKPVDPYALLETLEAATKIPLLLIIDDDTDLCVTLRDVMWDEGFRVSLAHDIRAARERLREDGFKVVLVDLRLPDGNGWELIRLIQEIGSTARTIMITGHRTEIEPSLAADAKGCDAVCLKPFDMTELLGIVRRLIK
jgi:two-component system response regulator HydG